MHCRLVHLLALYRGVIVSSWIHDLYSPGLLTTQPFDNSCLKVSNILKQNIQYRMCNRSTNPGDIMTICRTLLDILECTVFFCHSLSLTLFLLVLQYHYIQCNCVSSEFQDACTRRLNGYFLGFASFVIVFLDVLCLYCPAGTGKRTNICLEKFSERPLLWKIK